MFRRFDYFILAGYGTALLAITLLTLFAPGLTSFVIATVLFLVMVTPLGQVYWDDDHIVAGLFLCCGTFFATMLFLHLCRPAALGDADGQLARNWDAAIFAVQQLLFLTIKPLLSLARRIGAAIPNCGSMKLTERKS